MIKMLSRMAESLADRLLFALAGLFSRGKTEKGGKRRILVVKLDAIGDFILWLDAARGLRELYPAPSHHITLLGNSAWTGLARMLPHFDEVWELDRRRFGSNFFYRLTWYRKVKMGGFYSAIQPSFSRELNYGDSLIHASRAPERIGSTGDLSNITLRQKRRGDRWYTRLIPASPETMMELIRNAEFLRGLGGEGFQASLPVMEIKDVETPAGLPEVYYVLFPGSSRAIKSWPTESFARLVSWIFSTTGMSGVICGGKGEEGLAARIISRTEAPLSDFAGRTTLPQLAGLIAASRFLVGNDTSTVHIASAMGTPSVCILGGGHFGRFMPYEVEKGTLDKAPLSVFRMMECFGCGWSCREPYASPDAPVRCVDEITVEDVYEAVRKAMGDN